jgi:hypothetical protein
VNNHKEVNEAEKIQNFQNDADDQRYNLINSMMKFGNQN